METGKKVSWKNEILHHRRMYRETGSGICFLDSLSGKKREGKNGVSTCDAKVWIQSGADHKLSLIHIYFSVIKNKMYLNFIDMIL